MKILLIGEASKVHRNLRIGLCSLGHDCDHYTLSDAGVWNTSDNALSIQKSGYTGKIINNLMPIAKVSLLHKYDVVNYTNSITGVIGSVTRYLDLPILRRKVDLMSYYAIGCDQIGIIRKNNALPYSPCFGCLKDNGVLARDCNSTFYPEFNKSREMVRRYFDVGASGMVEYDHVEDLFPSKFMRIPLPVNLEEIEFNPAYSRKVTKIVHTPTRRGFKGTSVVLEAVANLRMLRDDFEFELIEGLPYPEYLKRIADADIVIDQVHSQSAGMNGLEMMAAGKVVVTGASKLGRSYHAHGCDSPAINGPPAPDELTKVLFQTIERKHEFEEIAIKGRSFVEEFHEMKIIAQQFEKLWAR